MTASPTVEARTPRTGAIIVLVIGAILTVTGPVFGAFAGTFAMIPGALETASSTTVVSPTGIVPLDTDESVYLLAPVAELEHIDHEDCAATGADGDTAPVVFVPASALNTLASGVRYESFAQVTASSTGTHEIACQTDGIPVIAAPPFTLEGLFGPLIWWTIAGIAASLAGIVLVIFGVVRLARTPSTR